MIFFLKARVAHASFILAKDRQCIKVTTVHIVQQDSKSFGFSAKVCSRKNQKETGRTHIFGCEINSIDSFTHLLLYKTLSLNRKNITECGLGVNILTAPRL